MNDTLKFSVVVPVLNSRFYLEASLGSIIRAVRHYGNAELVAMDNGSTDGSYELLLDLYASRGARVDQATGLTIAALRNRGAAATSGDVLVFLDSDCVIGDDYFERASEVLGRTAADATGSKVALPDAPTWIEETWYRLHSTEREGYTHYINSGNLVVRRSVFDAVGGFDESLTTGEDTDFGLRLNRHGYKVYAAPAVRAVHLANDKTLGTFFRKNAWRGLGMFASMRGSRLSKPVLMTFAHLLLVVLALAGMFAGFLPLWLRATAFLLALNAVPVTAVLYRLRSANGRVSLPRAVFLYHVYFASRILSLYQLAISRVMKRTPRRPREFDVRSPAPEKTHSARSV